VTIGNAGRADPRPSLYGAFQAVVMRSGGLGL
jgi:hypothetical protein